MKLINDCSFPARMRVHAVDYILKPSKAMRSLFRQVDEQASDSNIPIPPLLVLVM